MNHAKLCDFCKKEVDTSSKKDSWKNPFTKVWYHRICLGKQRNQEAWGIQPFVGNSSG